MDAPVGHDAVHACQKLAAVHDEPVEVGFRQLASELFQRAARHESQDRERQQLVVVSHLLGAEHLWRRHPDLACLRHDVRLVGEPRNRLTRDPDDHRRLVVKLDAVRLVQAATSQLDEPLDFPTAD